VDVLGQIHVNVEYEGQSKKLPLVITKGNKVSLFGRNWIEYIQLNWKEIFSVKMTRSLKDVLDRYQQVFKGDYGEIKDFVAHVNLKENSTPIFHKARPVPYALREAVDKEIKKLVDSGIYVKVESSEWASPVVVVPKANSQVRICGDYKVSINQLVEDQPYPLPTAEDIFSKLAGGKKFSKIDLSSAFQQLKVDETSRKYLTINTLQGLLQPTRLQFGIKTAPHTFQRVMDQVLQGIPGVCCYIDDILVTAKSDSEHVERIKLVLERLEKYGIRAKKEKCSFMAESVSYLGHIINAEGVHPQDEKVTAVKEAKVPENVQELRQFLGMVNYYGKFLPNLSTTLAPLNNLLRQNTPWKWSLQCDQAVEFVKHQLSHDRVLVHYDPKMEIVLACDASPYGVGAVLSHIVNGEERPIAYASRTLTTSEKGYAQIEKEALGIIFGVQKFNKYLYGRRFKLITDHKPLTAIFGPKKGIPTLAALRMQRWSLILMSYNYEIVYRKSEDHANADFLSRMPTTEAKSSLEQEINYFSYTDVLPVTAMEIRNGTLKDPVLSKVYDFTLNGWPDWMPSDELKPYYRIRSELSCDQGCLLWGMRVVIPPEYHIRLIEELHSEHLGIVRSKALARSYFWFPNLDDAIENMIQNCSICQTLQKDPPPTPLFPWKYPDHPWTRVHIDYAEYRENTI
jgi:hypothetical protein